MKMPGTKFSFHYHPPQIATGRIYVSGSAVCFQNTGNTVVMLSNAWSIAPGQSTSWNCEDDNAIVGPVNFSFDATGVAAPVNRLEVMELRNTNPGYSDISNP